MPSFSHIFDKLYCSFSHILNKLCCLPDENTSYVPSNIKQKMVIKVQMNCENSRTRALKVAVQAKGVINVSVEVEKEHVVVIGNGVDAVSLAKSLSNKLGHASIVSVEEVKKEKEEKPAVPIQWTSSYIHYPHCRLLYHDGVCSC